MPFNYFIYQDIRAENQYHRLQSSGWTAHIRVTRHYPIGKSREILIPATQYNRIHINVQIISDTIGLGPFNKFHDVCWFGVRQYENFRVYYMHIRFPYHIQITQVVMVEYGVTRQLYRFKNQNITSEFVSELSRKLNNFRSH